eukprot:604151-Rhodomonas_salina.8
MVLPGKMLEECQEECQRLDECHGWSMEDQACFLYSATTCCFLNPLFPVPALDLYTNPPSCDQPGASQPPSYTCDCDMACALLSTMSSLMMRTHFETTKSAP